MVEDPIDQNPEIGVVQAAIDYFMQNGLFGNPFLSKVEGTRVVEGSISAVRISNFETFEVNEDMQRILIETSIQYKINPLIFVHASFHFLIKGDQIIKLESSYSRIPTIEKYSFESICYAFASELSLFSSDYKSISHREVNWWEVLGNKQLRRLTRKKDRDSSDEYDSFNLQGRNPEVLMAIKRDELLFKPQQREVTGNLNNLFFRSGYNNGSAILIGLPATGKSTLEEVLSTTFLTSRGQSKNGATFAESFRQTPANGTIHNHLNIFTGRKFSLEEILAIHILSEIRDTLAHRKVSQSQIIHTRIRKEFENISIHKATSIATGLPYLMNGALLQYLTAILGYSECTLPDEDFESMQRLVEDKDIERIKLSVKGTFFESVLAQIFDIYNNPMVIFTKLDEEDHQDTLKRLDPMELERRSVSLYYLPLIKTWQEIIRLLLEDKGLDVRTFNYKRDLAEQFITKNSSLRANLMVWNDMFINDPNMLFILGSLDCDKLSSIWKGLADGDKLNDFLKIINWKIVAIEKEYSNRLFLGRIHRQFQIDNSLEIIRPKNSELQNDILRIIDQLKNDCEPTVFEALKIIKSNLEQLAATITRTKDPSNPDFNFAARLNTGKHMYSQLDTLKYLVESIEGSLN